MNRLLIVAGHAIYDRSKTLNSYFQKLLDGAGDGLPSNCYWHGFEPAKFTGSAVGEMVEVVEQHVRAGCSLVTEARKYDWISFSGGRTRKELHESPEDGNHGRQGILNSEGSGMDPCEGLFVSSNK